MVMLFNKIFIIGDINLHITAFQTIFIFFLIHYFHIHKIFDETIDYFSWLDLYAKIFTFTMRKVLGIFLLT